MCLENVGKVKLNISVDRGSLQVATCVIVDYKTLPDTALENEDFLPKSGQLKFNSDEKT